MLCPDIDSKVDRSEGQLHDIFNTCQSGEVRNTYCCLDQGDDRQAFADLLGNTLQILE